MKIKLPYYALLRNQNWLVVQRTQKIEHHVLKIASYCTSEARNAELPGQKAVKSKS